MAANVWTPTGCFSVPGLAWGTEPRLCTQFRKLGQTVFHSLFKSSLLPQEEDFDSITVNRKKCCSENLVTASNPASSLFPVLLRLTQEHAKCKG